jgi:hypothetical protein
MVSRSKAAVVIMIPVLLVLGLGLGGCEKKKAHDDPKDLSVTMHEPYNGQSDFHLNDPIVITFTAPVDPASANSNTIQIADPNGASPMGRFEVRDNEVWFWPQYPPGFSAMQTYTVSMPAFPITPSLMSTEGCPLIKTYSFQFTTGSDITPDTTNPYVISVDPPDNATGVARDTNITITFSEPIDSATVQSAFSLRDVAAGTVITGTLTLTNNQTVLHFDPEPSGVAFPQYLNDNTLYEIQLTASIRDIAGNSLQGAPWTSTFTTGDTPTTESARGPFIENFLDNINEDASQTTAEWNTVVPGSLVSQVHPQSTPESDNGPAADPSNAIIGPFETGPYRVCFLLLNSWFTTPLNQLAGKRITRLYWKHSGAFTAATYNNLIVRLGHTTLATMPVPLPANTTFSSLYQQAGNPIPPTVVSRLTTYAPTGTAGPGNAYVEIPIVGNFVYSGNAADNLIIDIEVTGGSAQNLMTGDTQATAGTPVYCRAISQGGTYDIIQQTDANVHYFLLEFGGSLGGSGIDGAGQTVTTLVQPVGTVNDINVLTGGTIDTSQSNHGYGHLRINTMYVAPGATLTVIGPNPCIIRATGTVRIEGRVNAGGMNGGGASAMANSGGSGGAGGPGGGTGGMGGNGATTGNGQNGTDGTGYDNQALQANGAGLLGSGGAAGAGGGGGGYAVAGSAGVNAGSAGGGGGGNVWGSPSILFLSGGAGGGGAGGGRGQQAAGGGGGGGGGGYLQIVTDRNMYIGAAASITAQGGNGGNAAALGVGGGGGAGSGGAILLQALNLAFTGTGAVINAQGGTGGQASAGGGAGAPQTGPPLNNALADGRIRIEANVTGLSNATIAPAVQTGNPLTLSGVYNQNPPSVVASDGYSIFIDTGCSAPRYTTADVQYSDSTSPAARVYINFVAADPDILSQPVNPQPLYAAPEPLPQGGTLATFELGVNNPGWVNGAPGTQSGTSLDGYRFIMFRIQLDTTDANTTAQVTRVTINYQY